MIFGMDTLEMYMFAVISKQNAFYCLWERRSKAVTIVLNRVIDKQYFVKQLDV